MDIAAKMFLKSGTNVPCIGLPSDFAQTDLKLETTQWPALKLALGPQSIPAVFVFVANSAELSGQLNELSLLWDSRVNFWVFYPKKPHLDTDLGRDATWKLMKQSGMTGTRQIAVGDLWSCMYFKNSGKEDYKDIA